MRMDLDIFCENLQHLWLNNKTSEMRKKGEPEHFSINEKKPHISF